MKKILVILFALFLTGCGEDPIPHDIPITSDPELPERVVTRDVPPRPTNIEVVKEKPVGKPAKERSGIVHLEFKSGLINFIGTGFFVVYGKNKYMLTAGHNVSYANKVSVFRNDGPVEVNILKHKVVQQYDMAAFLVETKEKCFELEDPKRFSDIPDYGKVYKPKSYKPVEVEMYGYPKEWHFRKVEGTIYQTIFDARYLVSTGDCATGMSGGPWFNKENGKVVAITSADLFNGEASGGVPISKIVEILNKMEKGNEKASPSNRDDGNTDSSPGDSDSKSPGK